MNARYPGEADTRTAWEIRQQRREAYTEWDLCVLSLLGLPRVPRGPDVDAPVAQWSEQRPYKAQADGSSPSGRTSE